MNYENQKLIDMLAAEYVLGTLRGLARDRFTRLMLTSTRAREATWKWEQHLFSLAGAIKSVTPESHVWDKINQRIDPTIETNVVSIKSKSTNGLLQAWSLIATAACFVLAIVVWQPINTATSQQIALFTNKTETPLWFIDVSDSQLSVKASAGLSANLNNDYELWMILKGQDTPISLGLMPKTGVKTLLKNNQFKAQDIVLLAVSLEPLGGSPNGLPTDVLYTTKLVVL